MQVHKHFPVKTNFFCLAWLEGTSNKRTAHAKIALLSMAISSDKERTSST
jgi:hypothetical protein